MKIHLLTFAACMVTFSVSPYARAQATESGRISIQDITSPTADLLQVKQKGPRRGGHSKKGFGCNHGFDKCQRLGYSVEQMSAPGWCASHFAKDESGRVRHRCPAKWGVKNSKPYEFDD